MTAAQKSANDDKIIELTVRMEQLAFLVEKLQEQAEGTVRTKGMKERITVAEFNIDQNRQAFKDMQVSISSLENRIGLSLVEMKNAFDRSLDEKLKVLVEDNKSNKSFIQKVSPWVNVIAWAITIISGFFLMQVLSGNVKIITP